MELPTMSSGRQQLLVDRIERLIAERTSGLIKGLRVEVLPGEVILSGWTQTYYAKQLATHAALDAIEAGSLVNSIEVH
jgi:hypothetical protein